MAKDGFINKMDNFDKKTSDVLDSGVVNVKSSFENGKIEISVQVNNPTESVLSQPTQIKTKPDLSFATRQVTPYYANNPVLEENPGKSQFKAVSTSISNRKSDISGTPADNILEHKYHNRNIKVHEVDTTGDSMPFTSNNRAKDFLSDDTKSGRFVDKKTFNELKETHKIKDYNVIKAEEVETKFTQNTKYSGGAKFETSFEGDKLKGTKVKLAKGRNRTDNRGFFNKAARASEAVDSAKEVLRNEEGELDDKIDAKTVVFIDHSIAHHKENRSRYKQLNKSLSKDIKAIKKQVKFEEKARKAERLNSKFDTDKGNFVDRTSIFAEDVDEKFAFKKKRDMDLFIDVRDNDTSRIGLKREKIISKLFRSSEQNSSGNISENKIEKKTSSSKKSDENKKPNDFKNMTSREKLNLRKEQRKATRKAKNKETRKIATRTAVANIIKIKKAMKSELYGESTGDYMKDGQGALLSVTISIIKNYIIGKLKELGKKIVKILIQAVISLFGFIITNLIPLLALMVPILAGATIYFFFFGSGSSSSDVEITSFDISVVGDGKLYSSLDGSEITDILDKIKNENPDISDEQVAALEYALSKVGCSYDQAYHSNTDVDIFDCSSLVYRAYQDAGIDVSYDGYYTAANECQALMDAGKTVTDDLQPGDLVFYGGSDNGRYMGIYHVAIYVGKVDGVDKMVEARDTDTGVVYCDLRSSNVVNVSRPT